MKTEALLKALKICRPAVDSAGIYPIFSHFCFSHEGSCVYGFNDVCAIMTELDIGVTGGLRGDVLMGLLPTLKEEVTIDQEGDTVTLQSGGTNLQLACLSEESFLFEMPDEEWLLELELTPAFFEGLAKCIQTVGDDAQHREFTGVVFHFNKGLSLYSSDDVRLSKFDASVSAKFVNRAKAGAWLVPHRACSMLLEAYNAAKDAAGDGEEPRLSISNDWLMFSAPSLLLYSKLMPETPPDHAATVKRITPTDTVWQAVPDDLKAALTRAEILIAKDPVAAVAMRIKKKALTVTLGNGGSTKLGELDEKIDLPSALPDLKLNVGVVKLSQSLAAAEEVSFSPSCIGLRSGNYTCWVSPLSEEAEEE